jgi:glyoxylase-like metal-dependent hydrolase (beta-lactamase superfamily II)
MSNHEWTTSGVFEVGPGIYRIPLPLPNDGLRAVNVYAAAEGATVVLIDSGWALARSRGLLETALHEIGYQLRDVRRFLVTHAHRDHYTQAVAIRRELGTPIALGQGERPGLELILDATASVRVRQSDRLITAGAFELAATIRTTPLDERVDDWAMPDAWLDGGQEITVGNRTLRVVETPGHTRGHVVFYDASAQCLFAGDHVLPDITPSIGVEPVWQGLPLADYLDSLRLVRALPDARLLPAHGPPTDSVHRRVDELLDHHEERLSATAKAVDHGADTAWEVARILRWTRRERRLDDLDLFNQMLATTETMAHLDVLVARQWLMVDIADGTRRYRRA